MMNIRGYNEKLLSDMKLKFLNEFLARIKSTVKQLSIFRILMKAIFIATIMSLINVPYVFAQELPTHSDSSLSAQERNTPLDVSMLTKKERLVLRLLEQVWAEGDLRQVDQLINKKYTLYQDEGDKWAGKTIDRETYKQRVLLSRDAFPDLRFKVSRIYQDKDKVIVSWFMQGTNLGGLPGGRPPTNKKINVPGITIYYFNGDLISGHWQVFDKLVMYKDLGFIH